MNRLHRILASLGLFLVSTVVVVAFVVAAPGGPAAAATAAQTIAELMPATIELAFFGLLTATVLGAAIGYVRACARAPVLSQALAVPPLVLRAIPVIVLALFLPLFFGLTGALPSGGIASSDAFDVRDRLAHLTAPVLCLGLPFGAWASSIFYDFFRGSGAARRRSVRSVAGPIAVVAASIGPALLAATFVVEPLVAWPGISRVFLHSVSHADLATVAGILLAYAACVVLIELAADFVPGARDRAVSRPSDSPQPSAPRAKRFSPLGVIAFVLLIGAVFGAVAADAIAPFGPYFIDQEHWMGYPLAPGVAGHVLGTEENGRDLLARVLAGIRTSLFIAAVAAVIATAIAAAAAKVPKVASWFGGISALSATGIRPFAGLPFVLVMVMLLVASLERVNGPSLLAVAVTIAVVSWPALVPAFRDLTRTTLAAVVDCTACALLLEITVSMFGFGVQPPTPSLGNMLANAQSNITVAPWAAFIPSVAGIVMLFALYAVGDELRAMDGRR